MATTSDTLPNEVVTCLQNARFLHLATCTHNRPHVSLMNYTYLPSHPFPSSDSSAMATGLPSSGPLIIMTTAPSSKKTLNLLQNPHVSLLVHDWVSTRPPNLHHGRDRSPPGIGGGGGNSSLATMLMQLNSAAVSSISATINGEATVLASGTEEEKWCKEQHLANNTFLESTSASGPDGDNYDQQNMSSMHMLSTSPSQARPGDGGRGSYIEDEDVRVVVVRIRDGRISDWKGGVKEWVIAESAEPARVADGAVDDGADGSMANGITELNGA